ncbi:MFS transporter|nr:MFS transporter [Dendrosporobacter quercicolus]NSL48747.1 MFS transporter [Dendrosporobacter quercicolus DSM 1736]
MNNAAKRNPVVTLSLITAACLIGDSMLYIVLPTHWKEAGLNSLWEVGILLSVNRLVRIPLNPLVGWIYKKISIRTGFVFATIVALLTTLSYGFVQGFLPLLMIRCTWGLAWTFLRLGAYFTIIDCSDDSNRGHFMGRYNGLYRLGSLFGMLIGGVIADHYGLQNTAFVFGLLTLSSVPFAFFYIPTSKNYENQIDIKTNNSSIIWKDTDILWALAAGTFVAMIYQGMFTSTLSHLIEVHNSSTVYIGALAIGAASLGGILQALRWSWEPWLAPWIGKKSDEKNGRYFILVATLGLASLLFSLIPFQFPVLLWIVILIGIQITATFLTTIADALASDVAVKSSSKMKVMTTYSLLIDFGAAVGPIFGYLLSEYIGIYSAYWYAALLLAILAFKYSFLLIQVISPNNILKKKE